MAGSRSSWRLRLSPRLGETGPRRQKVDWPRQPDRLFSGSGSGGLECCARAHQRQTRGSEDSVGAATGAQLRQGEKVRELALRCLAFSLAKRIKPQTEGAVGRQAPVIYSTGGNATPWQRQSIHAGPCARIRDTGYCRVGERQISWRVSSAMRSRT